MFKMKNNQTSLHKKIITKTSVFIESRSSRSVGLTSRSNKKLICEKIGLGTYFIGNKNDYFIMSSTKYLST